MKGLIILAAATAAALAQPQTTQPDLTKTTVFNRAAQAVTEDGRKAVRLDERAGDGVAWLENLQFDDGTIEIELKGKDALQQSFLGVAFHGLDDRTYEAVYFRPFNFRAPERRTRAIQYVSHPTYTWSKLREEKPGVYENAVTPAPDPNGWFRARIVVRKPKISVFVDGNTTPSLVVQELGERKGRRVGLWVGNGSGGAFANPRITR